MVVELSIEHSGPSYLQGFSVLCQVIFLLSPSQVSQTQVSLHVLHGAWEATEKCTEKALLGLQSEASITHSSRAITEISSIF